MSREYKGDREAETGKRTGGWVIERTTMCILARYELSRVGHHWTGGPLDFMHRVSDFGLVTGVSSA